MRILISTGEVSGDLQGSLLVEALINEAKTLRIDLEIIALGGQRMKAAGATLIADTSSIGAIGFWEAIPFIIPTLKIQALLNRVIRKDNPDCVVLIDYMGPNIRLGNKIKNIQPDTPIIYYIAPQEWAWSFGESGTTDLIGFSDKILAIFEEESEFYSKKGGKVKWVGHPMLDTLVKLPDRENAMKFLGIDSNRKVVLLFPASRSQELKYLMPTLAQAAAIMQKINPLLYFIVPSGLPKFDKPLLNLINEYKLDGKVINSIQVDDYKPYLYAVAELALGKSGTVNMELALNSIPQIVGYKISRVTAFILKKFLRFNIDYISPVNLLMKKNLIPELIQKDFTAEAIVELAIPLLENSEPRLKMLEEYKQFKNSLGESGVTRRAAKEILECISTSVKN